VGLRGPAAEEAFDPHCYDLGSRKNTADHVTAEKLATVALACVLAGSSLAACAQDGARRLIAIEAPRHDPLFIDAASVRRNGTTVTFKYLLDVAAPPDEGSTPSAQPPQWRSNEIDASIDCRQHTVRVRRLVAYSGPRGTGTATAVHSFTAPGLKAEPITPRSTFAYLEQHVCRDG
jgi:hypothetical protein